MKVQEDDMEVQEEAVLELVLVCFGFSKFFVHLHALFLMGKV